jgi:hypothetical protein
MSASRELSFCTLMAVHRTCSTTSRTGTPWQSSPACSSCSSWSQSIHWLPSCCAHSSSWLLQEMYILVYLMSWVLTSLLLQSAFCLQSSYPVLAPLLGTQILLTWSLVLHIMYILRCMMQGKTRDLSCVILPNTVWGYEWKFVPHMKERTQAEGVRELMDIQVQEEEMTGHWRQLHSGGSHTLYCSWTIRVIRWRRMILAGHVAHKGDKRNAYWVLVGKPE